MTGALIERFPTAGPLMSKTYYDLFRAETAKHAEEVADLYAGMDLRANY